MTDDGTLGAHLRTWRRRRGLSQHGLALETGVSQRHLAYLERGRARASRELVLRLCAYLDVPMRDRNQVLLAAGFAPVFGEGSLGDDALGGARALVEHVLGAQRPAPALALDRHWTVLAANAAVAPVLYAGVAPALLRPPVNILRVTFHPDGLAPRIANLGAWRAGVLAHLTRQASASTEPEPRALLAELRGYPASCEGDGTAEALPCVPLRLRTEVGELSLLSTVTVFATPTSVVLAELLLETFHPASEADAARLGALVGQGAAAHA